MIVNIIVGWAALALLAVAGWNACKHWVRRRSLRRIDSLVEPLTTDQVRATEVRHG